MIFTRFEPLIGAANLSRLKQSHVLVVGCGGVGSFAIEALVRSGIGALTLIDYDKVEITNINRQLMALHSTLNQRKVDVLKHRILDINPACKVTTHALRFNAEACEMLAQQDFDFIVDAIDQVNDKIDLIAWALKTHTPIISVMGQGNRLDPSQLTIKDIQKTTYDRLAKAVRLGLRKRQLNGKIPVVISETSACDIPRDTPFVCSSAFVPSSAGLLAASYVIQQLIEVSK